MDTRSIIDLIAAGAKLKTVQELTSLPATKAKYLWQLENMRPPAGRTPSIGMLVRTKSGHIEASIAGHIIQNLIDQRLSPIDITITAYTTLKAFLPYSHVSVEHIYIIYKLIVSGSIRITKCGNCSGNILRLKQNHEKTKKCCYCRAVLSSRPKSNLFSAVSFKNG